MYVSYEEQRDFCRTILLHLILVKFENTLQQQSLKDKQSVADNVAVNKNRVLHDTSKRGGGIY